MLSSRLCGVEGRGGLALLPAAGRGPGRRLEALMASLIRSHPDRNAAGCTGACSSSPSYLPLPHPPASSFLPRPSLPKLSLPPGLPCGCSRTPSRPACTQTRCTGWASAAGGAGLTQGTERNPWRANVAKGTAALWARAAPARWAASAAALGASRAARSGSALGQPARLDECTTAEGAAQGPRSSIFKARKQTQQRGRGLPASRPPPTFCLVEYGARQGPK